jgi:hypothetical protein
MDKKVNAFAAPGSFGPDGYGIDAGLAVPVTAVVDFAGHPLIKVIGKAGAEAGGDRFELNRERSRRRRGLVRDITARVQPLIANEELFFGHDVIR